MQQIYVTVVKKCINQVLPFVTLFLVLFVTFEQGLNRDLHLGDQRVTWKKLEHVGVSKNRGTQGTQIIHFNRVSLINHPFWGTIIFGNTHVLCYL